MRFNIIRTQAVDVPEDESSPQKNVYELHATNVQTHFDNNVELNDVLGTTETKIIQDPVTGAVLEIVTFITRV